tara:strand:- start:56 stop:241 length:186 start_codon:yes stop_codon:yes gene_type:complete
VPSSGNEEASAKTIESEISVISPFNVVVADENPVAEASVMLDVLDVLDIAPFNVVAAPPRT